MFRMEDSEAQKRVTVDYAVGEDGVLRVHLTDEEGGRAQNIDFRFERSR